MANAITEKLQASVTKGKYIQTLSDSLGPSMKKMDITFSNEMLELFSTNIGQITEIMNPLLNKMHIMIGMLEKLMTRGDYPESEYPAAIKEYHEIEDACVKKLEKLQQHMDLTIKRDSKETYKNDNSFIGPSIGYIKKMDGMLNAVKGHLGRATVKWKESDKSKGQLSEGEQSLVSLIYGSGDSKVNFVKKFYQEHYAPLIITPFELLQVKGKE